VFVHGAAATPTPLLDALSARTDVEGVRLYHLHTQGCDTFLAPAVAEFSSRLIMETTALVDVFAQVLRHASDLHGNAVKADDVRSFVVTAYINASKGQGGRNAA